jgi:hypothetical protein
MRETIHCLSADGRPKKRYVSEAAAKRDLLRSHRWRRRATLPVPYRCPCGYFHLTRGER